MLIRKLFFLAGLLLSFSSVTFAVDNGGPGLSASYPLITLEPKDLNGYRVSLWYQPKSFIWSYVKLYFDGSYGHWWVNDTDYYKPVGEQLNIYSLAPVARFYYPINEYISPFFDISIGFSYLSETKIYTRNLGMHFSFQDQLGVGALFGREQRVSLSLSAAHYSNGALCNRNSGITIPLMLNLGVRL